MLTKEIRDARRAAGLCTVCGKQSTQGYATCEACREKARAAQKKCAERKKENGICMSCGNAAPQGYTKCEACREKEKTYKKRYNDRCREQEKCIRCGAHVADGVYCDKCKAMMREGNAARKTFMLAHGMCTICGKNRPFEGRRICEDCLQKRAERRWAMMSTPEGRETAKGYVTAWTQKMKDAGRCVSCGGVKENPEITLCEKCRYKKQIRSRIYYAKTKVERPWNQCRRCGALAVPGKKLCEEHYAAQMEIIKKARTAINREEHPWRETNKLFFRLQR